MRAGRLALVAFAAALAACSSEAPAPSGMLLPTADDLPYRFNQDCGCVRDGQCTMIEERLGAFEIRKLDCRWQRPNAVALCRFEERFIAHDYRADGKLIEHPEPWAARELRATLLADGQWCAG
jgi:hypothetical protein